MKTEMNILTASLSSDASVVIHSNNSLNDSETETTVLTEQVMQLGKNTSKNSLDEELLMISCRSCSLLIFISDVRSVGSL